MKKVRMDMFYIVWSWKVSLFRWHMNEKVSQANKQRALERVGLKVQRPEKGEHLVCEERQGENQDERKWGKE